jgi:hypothetical protein
MRDPRVVCSNSFANSEERMEDLNKDGRYIKRDRREMRFGCGLILLRVGTLRRKLKGD